MIRTLPLPLFAFALLVYGCGTPATDQAIHARDTDSIPKVERPSWTGFYTDTVPCADCPGIITRLHLKADSTYLLTDQYLERDSIPYGEMGRWTVAEDKLSLHTGDAPRLWKRDGNRLDPLDQEGMPIESPLALSIERVEGFPGGAMYLTGGYVYYADAHSFTPVGSAFAYPVAMDKAGVQGAGLALERLYAKLVKTPPTPLQVRIVATLITGPAMEGNGTEQYIHVERLEGPVGK